MISIDNANSTWYRCPNCLNYSFKPMECCGENMIEEREEETKDASLVIVYEEDY